MAELEKAEEARMMTLANLAAVEEVIHVLRSEPGETVILMEARLYEKIGWIERDISSLSDQVAALEANKVRLLARPSSSHTSTFFDIP